MDTLRQDLIDTLTGTEAPEVVWDSTYCEFFPLGEAEADKVIDALVGWLRSHQLETIAYRYAGNLRRCDLGRIPSEELADLLEDK